MASLPRQTISAVVMSKNSAPFIEGCLKSIDWVDEIVVIDGYSTDQTVDICKKFTDKIIQNRWDGFRFCTERNLGTFHASSDWILHIDPDERSTEEFKEAVLKMLSDRQSPYVAYKYLKKNYFLGHFMRYGGWYHDTMHLFKKGAAWYEGIIHENLNVVGPSSMIGRIEAEILHYPFDHLAGFISRHNGYSEREAYRILEEEGVLSEGTIWYQIVVRPLKKFNKFFIKKKGYKDGMVGFIFSVLFAWVHFINWAKYWELITVKKITDVPK